MLTWHYSLPVRLVLVLVLAAVTLGTAFAIGSTNELDWFLALAGPLLAFGLGWALVRRVAQPVEFHTLTAEERQEALQLAWVQGPVGSPNLSPLLAVAIVPALIAIFVPLTPDSFDVARAKPWIGVELLAAVIGGLAQFFWVAPRQLLDAKRQAAARWCHRWQPHWLTGAITAVGERTQAQLQVEGQAEAHVLLFPHASAHTDIPPHRFDLQVLLVGPFLAVRRGAFLNVYATSVAQGTSANPETPGVIGLVDDSTQVAEQEVHFRDVVSVDYERVPQATTGAQGILRVSLASGQKIEFPTLEQGVSSALDSIRKRTRATKLGMA